ncbi:hypothetical protein LCGC14_0637670 [marine sediment metagenome]|uniref:Uncharacterized protein n=1 Tax=marine sediment metagenome TaxID=412755 RepID=A0A0F9TLL7_9ZZZZ
MATKYTVSIENAIEREFATEALANAFITKTQTLLGAATKILKNEVKPLSDDKGVVVSSVTKRLAQYP